MEITMRALRQGLLGPAPPPRRERLSGSERAGGTDAPPRWAAVRRWAAARAAGAGAGLEESRRRERALAEALRRALGVPTAAAASFGGLDVEAACLPWDAAAHVGGDFYDAFRLDGDRVALVVGDVCGRGAAAAAHVAPLRWGLRALLLDDPAPGAALTRYNDALCREGALPPPAPAAVTAALTVAVVDTARGTARCAVAGAEPPLLRRAGGEARPVAAAGALLGVLPGHRYAETPLALAPGDVLLLATDGVTEARCAGEFLGPAGVARLVAAAGAGARPLAQAVLEGARAYAGGLLHDDACVLAARRPAAHV